MIDPKGKKCYGSVTVGERGQVVIPASAREELKIEAGEKLFVFQVGKRGIIMIKAESIIEFVSKMMKRFIQLQEIADQEGEEDRKEKKL